MEPDENCLALKKELHRLSLSHPIYALLTSILGHMVDNIAYFDGN